MKASLIWSSMQAEEEERAATELASRLEKKLVRKQDMRAKHRELDEGLQRVRARIRHQETLLQVGAAPFARLTVLTNAWSSFWRRTGGLSSC